MYFNICMCKFCIKRNRQLLFYFVLFLLWGSGCCMWLETQFFNFLCALSNFKAWWWLGSELKPMSNYGFAIHRKLLLNYFSFFSLANLLANRSCIFKFVILLIRPVVTRSLHLKFFENNKLKIQAFRFWIPVYNLKFMNNISNANVSTKYTAVIW